MSNPQNVVTVADIRAAAIAIAAAIGDSLPWAVVGGGACVLLGSQRVTDDIDFVVPTGHVSTARQLLRASGAFHVEPRTNHTTFAAANVDIDILYPPRMFASPFDGSTPTVAVGEVRVLHPLLLLNAKCGSLPSRSKDDRKRTDAHDIVFLLEYCAEQGLKITPEAVPNAIPEFIEYSIQQGYVPERAWRAAGCVEGCE